ncbi:UDP-N-acetylmuramate dehydrogenase [Schaalia canis]|uniref:UDP-N-acetylenolpyruvoylglucosamine reductase n=1 Tax=Schaalia canis TaxID=100469 RepID=A0A3P1SEU0_9ACTO|nr:UDP-N-acetylmuramate dehydrogenase [Schaalia canis]RRC95668.1 UDP-N-acetylmuramate dehydrogenase [Schaalia canis]
MTVLRGYTLADLTTFRVGGPIDRFVRAGSEAELIAQIREADADGTPLLIIGGGSNILASDDGFEGLVLQDARSEITVVDDGANVSVQASAGTNWDMFVAWTLEEGLSGLEALSGIPGTVGASPVQNVGAYGQDVSATLKEVRAWDRDARKIVTLSREDLHLSYRHSVLKESLSTPQPSGRTYGPTGRWVVLSVTFSLPRSSMSAPVLYGELARHLGVEVGQSAPSTRVREAVLSLRRGKGMVLDPGDHDTWSAGSFFTNPILSDEAAAALPEGAPRFPAGQGRVKTSAAWLIDHAGFAKGFAVSEGAPASLSTRHVLALTNRGGARASDVVALARRVRDGVREAFGVTLVPEPVAVGISW